MQKPPQKRSRTEVSLREEIIGRISILGIEALAPGSFNCPAHECNQKITVTEEFAREFPSSFRALAVLKHISVDCARRNRGWVYTVLCGFTGDKVYVGYWKDHQLLRRWIKHQSSKDAGPLMREWNGLYNVPKERSLVWQDMAEALVDLRPGDKNFVGEDGVKTGDDENKMFMRLFLTFGDDFHEKINRLRGAAFVSPKLPSALVRLLADEDGGRCYRCFETGHSIMHCPSQSLPMRTKLFRRFRVKGTEETFEGADDQLEANMVASEAQTGEDGIDERDESSEDGDGSKELNADTNEVEFQSKTLDKKQMLRNIYSKVQSSELLSIGYLQEAETKEQQTVIWDRKIKGYPKVISLRELQSEMVKQIPEADGSVFFVNGSTGSGKSFAVPLVAIEKCMREPETTVLIVTSNRNVVGAHADGVFKDLTSQNMKSVGVSMLKNWDAGFRPVGSVDEACLGGDILIDVDRGLFDPSDPFAEVKLRRRAKMAAKIGGNFQTIPWCVWMGSSGLKQLKDIHKSEWFKSVRILIATVDMVAHSLSTSFRNRLGLVIYDEAHLATDDFGANLAYVFETLKIPRFLAGRNPPTMVFMSASGDEPEKLAGILATVSPDSVRVLGGVTKGKYITFYSNYDESGRKPNLTPSLDQLYKFWMDTMPGDKGTLLIFVSDDGEELRYKLLDRHNFPNNAAVISFHTSKAEINSLEAKLRQRKGQANLVCSITANHGLMVRLLRGVSLDRRIILATAALHTGQNIPETACVLVPVVKDITQVQQPMGRAGRESKAVAVLFCKDKELEGRIRKDAGEYLLGSKTVTRIPVHGAVFLYKGAYHYLRVLRELIHSEPDKYEVGWLDKQWYTTLLGNQARHTLFQTPLAIDIQQEVLDKTYEEALAFFRQGYAESIDVPVLEVGPHLNSLREMERKIPVWDIDKNMCVAEYTTLEAFRDLFPSFCTPSIHQPKCHWEWVDAEMIEEVGTDEPSKAGPLTIDNLTKIFIRQSELPGGVISTRGVCARQVAQTLREVCDERTYKFSSMKILEVLLITRFSGFTHGGGELEQPPDQMFNERRVDIWRKDSRLARLAYKCVLKIDDEVLFDGSNEWLVEVVDFISDRFNMSDECFSVGADDIKHSIEIVEGVKGRACGLGKWIQNDEWFLRDLMELLYPPES